MPDSDTPKAAEIRRSFQVCRDELKHEYGVLGSRLTAFLTSQAFLISAFAVAMNNPASAWGIRYRFLFPLLLAVVGVLLSIRAVPGIIGVCQIIERWHIRQKELLDLPGETLDDWRVIRMPTVASANERNLWFAKSSAWILMVAWSLMGAIAVWARLVST